MKFPDEVNNKYLVHLIARKAPADYSFLTRRKRIVPASSSKPRGLKAAGVVTGLRVRV